MTTADAITAALDRMGFLTEPEVAALAADPKTRLLWLLVRCNGGRFSCPAQDVKHFIALVERRDPTDSLPLGEWVRDVSIPADTLERLKLRRDWHRAAAQTLSRLNVSSPVEAP